MGFHIVTADAREEMQVQEQVVTPVVAGATDCSKLTKKRQSTHTRPRPLMISLDQPGRVRVGHWLALLDLSASPFYERLKTGRVPKADGHDGRPYWLTSTVKAYLENPGG